MKTRTKTTLSVALSTLITTFVVAAGAYAATTNIESLRVGTAGSGGVTFFNGTILNESADEPLTIGDDLRVDGRMWRGETAGPLASSSDDKPFIINDDLKIEGYVQVERRTSKISVPPAAFTVSNPSGAQYVINGTGLSNTRTDQNDNFAAPVYLPHNAVVSKVTVYYDSNNAEDISVQLTRVTHEGDQSTVASGTSVDGQTSVELTLDDVGTDSGSSYYLWTVMPKKDDINSDVTELNHVVIEYTEDYL